LPDVSLDEVLVAIPLAVTLVYWFEKGALQRVSP